MDATNTNITTFFEELLNDIDCQADTRAYIIGVYGKYRNPQHDFSKHSITLLFADARRTHEFTAYQNLADWLLWCQTVSPAYLQDASKDYYTSVAQLSYYSCYNLINRRWRLFQELADRFLTLEEQIKNRLANVNKLAALSILQ